MGDKSWLFNFFIDVLAILFVFILVYIFYRQDRVKLVISWTKELVLVLFSLFLMFLGAKCLFELGWNAISVYL